MVIPCGYEWRQVAVFNPAFILENGVFYMFELVCSGLDTLKRQVGLLSLDALGLGANCSIGTKKPLLRNG